MQIKVTKEHIKRGQRNSAKSCPIALALTALGKRYVNVDGVYCVWRGGAATLPGRARDFINRFDEGWPTEPFAFTVVERNDQT